MSTNAAYGRKAAANRPGTRRLPRIPALAGALALGCALAPGLAPGAAAQSRSGITINNDVLNTLGPGPAPAPLAPLAPAGQPSRQWDGQPVGLAPAFPPAQGGDGGLSFDPYGSGNFVMTRPGTLLFPPLQAPTSTLTSGFDGDADNHAARARALDSAFAEGPEPHSQLLIPLDGPGAAPAAGNSSVMVFMDRLPPADPNADPAAAPVLVLQAPPQPAPRKPAVPEEMLAEWRQPVEAPAALAPEFVAPEPPAMAEVAPEVPVEQTPLASAEPLASAAPLASAEPTAPVEPPAAAPAVAEPAAAHAPAAEPPAVDLAASDLAASDLAAAPPPTERPAANRTAAEPLVAVAAAPASPAAGGDAPVSLLPATPAGLQTASLTVGATEGTSFLFEVDSAELSSEAQSELRALADALRGDGGDIQVLGFASGTDASEDQARKLALSRALKVRSFLIDSGIASGRIRVRSLGDRADGGPANRVDIKPIGS